MTKKPARIVTLLTLCFITIALNGCTTTGKAPEPGNMNGAQNNMQQEGTIFSGQEGMIPGPGQDGVNPMNYEGNYQPMTMDKEKSSKIEEQLKNINGVENINVMVNGNTALVGYKPSGAAGDPTATKAEIVKKVKEIDKSITEVRVSEAPDIMSKMKKLSTDLTNNKAVDNISSEFDKIFKDISPMR